MHRRVGVLGRRARRRSVPEQPGDAEIGQQRESASAKKHVRGGHVAVDDAAAVGLRHCRGNRGERGDRLARGQPTARSQQPGESAARSEVEHQHQCTINRYDPVQTHQMWMVQTGEKRRLGQCCLALARISERDPLERYCGPGGTHAALPHLAVATHAEQLLNSVARQSPRWSSHVSQR